MNRKIDRNRKEKKCSKCETIKPMEEFFNSKASIDGKGHYCKKCHKIVDGKYRNHEKDKERSLIKTYGLDLKSLNELFEKQDKKCAICGKLSDKVSHKRGLVVDHDHDTGEVRGLLCASCNMGLGYFKDCIEELQKAINYLKPK